MQAFSLCVWCVFAVFFCVLLCDQICSESTGFIGLQRITVSDDLG
jgi:hypothetical protein